MLRTISQIQDLGQGNGKQDLTTGLVENLGSFSDYPTGFHDLLLSPGYQATHTGVLPFPNHILRTVIRSLHEKTVTEFYSRCRFIDAFCSSGGHRPVDALYTTPWIA